MAIKDPIKRAEANKRLTRAWRDRKRAEDPVAYAAKKRDSRLWTTYRLRAEDWAKMHDAQGGVCAICGEDGGCKGLVVDHRHSDDAVRGLLCTRCNVILGMAKDNPDVLAKAIEYLK